MAIGVTVTNQLRASSVQGTGLQPTKSQQTDFVATTDNVHEFSRSEKLQQLKDKIAASSELSIAAAPPVEILEEAPVTNSTSSAEVLAQGPQLCPGYFQATPNWSPLDVQIAEAEGVRLVYREREVVVPTPVSTSTQGGPAETQVQRDILAQLPIRTIPSASTSCIPTDIVGIATDGSLIRNGEAGVYGIFGSNTLVGWALDGFPIYGSSATAGDVCGGVMTTQGYRYQISAQRDTIINCFSANPIRL